MTRIGALLCTMLLSSSAGPAVAGESATDEIVPREALAIASVGRGGRAAVVTDAIAAQIAAGRWRAPRAGDVLSLPDGFDRTWEPVNVGADGWFSRAGRGGGGYLYVPVSVPTERIMILEAAGHGMAYVNGEPRVGDPYGYGTVRVPVLLRQGSNDLLFAAGRGLRVRVRLVQPRAEVELDARDATLPDLIVGERGEAWAALVAINATRQVQDGLSIAARLGRGRVLVQRLPTIPPLSTRKVPFRIAGAPTAPGERSVRLELSRRGSSRVLDALTVTVRVRRPHETRKRTFISDIDGSVQYYAVNPARPPHPTDRPLALFLSLHGAAVEAIGQADAYAPKTWGHLVAPTNRRPYGFDWEDWGRLDALEVLERAQKELRTDPQRVYLTGHSMGGHGTWIVGATHPDRFAAIGPSAGWISFASYVGAGRFTQPTPVEEILQRAASPSDTLALVRNYSHYGVYVLHGDADDNVPVTEARAMREQLALFHRDFTYHEQPGAGHWWGNSDEPGAACVDWPPMFDFFARHSLPPREAVRQVEFTTLNPGVSAWSHWAGIHAQIRALKPSTVRIRHDPWLRRFVGTTDNVLRLALDLTHVLPGAFLTVELDGQKIEKIPWPAGEPRLWLAREGGSWKVTQAPSPALKGPERCGPFKDAFRNRMVLVYGTRGTADENAWAFARARYDAETFWYRGNGAVDVVPDNRFDPGRERDRNVILYGNADTNAAWAPLLGESPVQVRRGSVRVGDRELAGEDLGCLFVHPRPGSDRASVGVVAGSGVVGMRTTDRLPYFLAGVGYPDCTVLGPEFLTEGARGIRGAGFFGPDWGVPTGEFAWRE